MNLKELWKHYSEDGVFNIEALPEELIAKGTRVEYKPNSVMVSKGEFPANIYFILEGNVAGVREYSNGNVYSYFRLDEKNGSIGLLEILAKQEEYIATIVTVTEVKALRIDSAVVYRAIMEDIGFLRKCSNMLSDDLYKRSGNDGVFYYLAGIDRVRYFLTNYYNDHPERKNEKGQMIVQAEYQEIANTIGMSIRTVGRNLQRLRETDEIRSERKKIVIGQKQYENLMSHLYA
nr:Crp/Fnr family transcriptional regulator [uncultured Sellimonas sp.]